MVIFTIIILLLTLLFSILSFLFRIPGPKGDTGPMGPKGKDAFVCDNLTGDDIIFKLKECKEIILDNTTLKVNDIKTNNKNKTKKISLTY